MTNPSPSKRFLRWQHAILLLICLLSSIPSVVLADELSDAETDLFSAMADEDVEAATAALKAGASIDAISPRGNQTPLMQSVLHGRTTMVKFCLENGADATIAERDGYTPMHGAGFQGRTDIAKMLFDHGVSLRDKHKDGHEPVIRTCWGPEPRHTEALAFFLDNGVPLDDIYEMCMEMTKNAGTKALLQERKGRGEL